MKYKTRFWLAMLVTGFGIQMAAYTVYHTQNPMNLEIEYATQVVYKDVNTGPCKVDLTEVDNSEPFAFAFTEKETIPIYFVSDLGDCAGAATVTVQDKTYVVFKVTNYNLRSITHEASHIAHRLLRKHNTDYTGDMFDPVQQHYYIDKQVEIQEAIIRGVSVKASKL